MSKKASSKRSLKVSIQSRDKGEDYGNKKNPSKSSSEMDMKIIKPVQTVKEIDDIVDQKVVLPKS